MYMNYRIDQVSTWQAYPQEDTSTFPRQLCLAPANVRGLLAEAIIHSREEERIKAIEKEQERAGPAS